MVGCECMCRCGLVWGPGVPTALGIVGGGVLRLAWYGAVGR